MDYDTGLVVAAAGSSRRFGTGENKLLLSLAERPVLCYCLESFVPSFQPDHVFVMVPAGQEEAFRQFFDVYEQLRSVQVLAGGATRQESVMKGVAALPETVSIAVIQDGARPFTSKELLNNCIANARTHGSGVAARRVTDTIKVATEDGDVLSTPDRRSLWAVETPQVFERLIIERAYQQLMTQGEQVTDDAQALERTGHRVRLVAHEDVNLKITHAADIAYAEFLLSHRAVNNS